MNAVPLVCFPFVGDLIGGSHISASGLIRRLDRARYEPLVLLQQPDGPIGTMFRDLGIALEAAPMTPSLAHGESVDGGAMVRLIARSPAMAWHLRRRRVAIVHVNDGRTAATWALAAKLARARLLWHHRGAPDAIGARWIAPLVADRIVAVSRYAAPAARFRLGPAPAVVHSPFDTDAVHDRSAARSAILAVVGRDPSAARDTRLIAFSGAMIERKRPLRFVETIAAMHQRSPDTDVHGVMFGQQLDGSAKRITDRAAELGVSDRIHLLGFRAPGAFWLAGCDALLVPAVDEPFGRTLVEAMLVGTPVIATASGGNAEALRDGAIGLLVPPEQPVALALAALHLLGSPDQANHIAALARADALHRFGEAMHADAIMAIYDGMVRARGTQVSSPTAPNPAREPWLAR